MQAIMPGLDIQQSNGEAGAGISWLYVEIVQFLLPTVPDSL